MTPSWRVCSDCPYNTASPDCQCSQKNPWVVGCYPPALSHVVMRPPRRIAVYPPGRDLPQCRHSGRRMMRPLGRAGVDYPKVLASASKVARHARLLASPRVCVRRGGADFTTTSRPDPQSGGGTQKAPQNSQAQVEEESVAAVAGPACQPGSPSGPCKLRLQHNPKLHTITYATSKKVRLEGEI